MGLRDAFRKWRDGRNVRAEVDAIKAALLARLKTPLGPGRGVDLSMTDPVEMLAAREIIADPRYQHLDIMQFAGALQLCWKADRAATMSPEMRKLLESQGVLLTPDKIILPDE